MKIRIFVKMINNKMKLEFIAPHSLNMGEEFEYMAAFKKSTDTKDKIGI